MARDNLTLEAQHISRQYAGHVIIDDVSLSLKPGELTALVGPNGTGKSTLIRILAHLDPGHTGLVSIRSVGPLAALSPADRASYIGWVGDRNHVPFAFTAFETVRLGRFAKHRGTPSRADDDAAYRALERFDMSHLASREITALSSGERQKTMLARLIAGEAPILLLDEPLTNLDIGSSLKLLELLGQLAQAGATICFTIHDLSLAYRFADRVLCLAEGKICADGAAKDVLLSEPVAKAFSVRPVIEPGLFLLADKSHRTPNKL